MYTKYLHLITFAYIYTLLKLNKTELVYRMPPDFKKITKGAVSQKKLGTSA